MKQEFVKDLEPGDEKELSAWVYRVRHQKSICFLVLRDSTGIVQAVVKKNNVSEETWETTEGLYQESSVTVKGKVVEDERAPTGIELKIDELTGRQGEPFPIQENQSQEFLADNRHLWLRSRKMTSVMKIRDTVFDAIRTYFKQRGFYEFHAPIFQATQSEGGSEVFSVPYFDDEMYLTQSWQLPAETGIFGLEKIYTISPAFRAEKSRTSRHLTEFWMAEAEEAWCTFEDVIHNAEGTVKKICKDLLEKRKEELEYLDADIERIKRAAEKPFRRITYTEALKILEEEYDMHVEWGEDLGTVEEKKIISGYDVPVIITNYPKACKAFYMKEVEDNPDVVQGCDILIQDVGEIVGGSQREEEKESIIKRLEEEGENPEDYDFYLDTRRYGSVPHGGFGLGVERVIQWAAGLDSVREAIPYPRTMTRTHP